MASLMARIRAWLGVEVDHDEKREMAEALVQQQTRVRALDAYVQARVAHDRRQALLPVHPMRRRSDHQ